MKKRVSSNKKFKYQIIIISHVGGNIPQSIKDAVLRGWLLGESRETIVTNNDISAGSVSKIIDQSRSNIPDLDLMRQIALMAKKREIDLNSIGPAIRLKKHLIDSIFRKKK